MQCYVCSRGLSLVETLIGVLVLGLVASIGAVSYSNIRNSSRTGKLMSDVSTVNAAVRSYLAFAGGLGGVEDADSVLARLKTRAGGASSRAPGITGSFLDARVVAVWQTEEEAAGPQLRAHWNAEEGAFKLSTGGGPGIKEFRFDESLGEQDFGEEERKNIFEYASESTWIWDYRDRTPPPLDGPTVILTTAVPDPGIPPANTGSPSPSPPPVNPGVNDLVPPQPSIGGGSYSITDYDLSVSLLDSNAAGTAQLVYSLNYGPWQDYAGSPIPVAPDQVLQVQALPVDPSAYGASTVAQAKYVADPVILTPPMIALTSPEFGNGVSDVSVTITHANEIEVSRVDYRINGGAWSTYSGIFVLNSGTYPDGAVIEAVAVATVPYYLDSSVANASIGVGAPSGPDPFLTFCASGLADYGVTILDGGRYRTSHGESGVNGDVAIGPGGTWSISDGAVTGTFHIHPGTSGSLGNGDDQFGAGGNPIMPVIADLSGLRQAALDMSSQATALPATQTFGKIGSSMILTASAPDGINVINVQEIALSGGSVLTISGGADDYVIVNIAKSVKMSGGSTWSLQGGIKPSRVLFNLLPGASEFGGTGASDFSSAAIILAPHPGTKVVITGASVVVGNIITATEFTATGGSQLLGAGCD